MTIKVSIVTAVWNREATLGDAIKSIQSQTYPHIEHVIQDGASSDGTLAVINALANAQTSLESVRDSGIYDGINKGISRATGDVIGLLHSDDILAGPDIIARVVERFEANQTDGVYGDLEYVSADDLDKIVRYWKSGEYHKSKLKSGWMPPHPTLYLQRDVFDKWGLYDTELKIAADYDAMLRYLQKGDISLAYLPKVMVKMRLGGASNKSLSHIMRKSREDLRALRRNEVGGLGSLAIKNLSKLEQFIARAK